MRLTWVITHCFGVDLFMTFIIFSPHLKTVLGLAGDLIFPFLRNQKLQMLRGIRSAVLTQVIQHHLVFEDGFQMILVAGVH